MRTPPLSKERLRQILRGIPHWQVVLEGAGAGIWSGPRPYRRATGLKRFPVHAQTVKGFPAALELWRSRNPTPPRLGFGRHVLTEEDPLFTAIWELLPPEAAPSVCPQFLIRSDGSYSDRQRAMGFATAIYAQEQEGLREIGRVQGGNVGWGNSILAEFGAVAIALTLVPPGVSVQVESDLKMLTEALEGKHTPNGEAGIYLKIIHAIIQHKKLVVSAVKQPRETVVLPHELAQRGRKAQTTSGPIHALLQHVNRAGGRALVLEAFHALENGQADPDQTWAGRELARLRQIKPDLFQEAQKALKSMTPEEVGQLVAQFRLEAMRAKPPTEKQLALLRSLGAPAPADRAEAARLIEQLIKRKRR